MQTMKAVRIHSFGGPDVLKFEDLPCPEPKQDEVLVRVVAASVNPIDYKIRLGQRVKQDELPLTMGCDISGRVARCGTRVRDWKEGDAVFAMLARRSGGYAEYVTLKASEIARKPRSLDHEHAAAVPLAAITAWQGLVDYGALKRGQRVLIHGAAGGVRHFAVQIAKSIGAEVIVTGASADAGFLHAMGASQVIDYQTKHFEHEVHDVDLVFDLIGGETRERSWAVIKRGGTLVSTVGQPSKETARAHGVRAVGYVSHPNAIELADIAQLIDNGRIKPFVQSSYPLNEAAKAQDHLEHDHARGKTVLKVANDSA